MSMCFTEIFVAVFLPVTAGPGTESFRFHSFI